jgi:hypothetical protein
MAISLADLQGFVAAAFEGLGAAAAGAAMKHPGLAD